jgi:hypothetical protein
MLYGKFNEKEYVENEFLFRWGVITITTIG